MTQKRRKIREAKAEQTRKKRKARRRRRTWFLLSQMMLFAVLLGAWFVVDKYDRFQLHFLQQGELEVNEGVEKEGYTTIALFGGDSRDGVLEAGTHADTIMVVSIHNKTKDVKIVSVYRDTMLEQADGNLKKANSAYFTEGPTVAINMLNRNLDLNISDYVTVDFKALADAIDALGGIEVEVTAAEAEAANQYVGETASVVGGTAQPLVEGVQTLDGVQAVTYARIRKNVGGDYKRTERQRLVIEKVVEKVKQSDIATLNEVINQSFSQVSTSFTLKELLSMALGVMKYDIKETSGFPFDLTDGRVDGLGSVVIPLGLEENVQQLHAFLYEEEAYEVSDTVKRISDSIVAVTGYNHVDSEEE